MLTRWGRDIDRDAVLDDYPRPQMARDDWLNLNGAWQYAITPKTAPPPTEWQGEILVPFCVESKLSGVERRLSPADRLWYQRTFSVSETGQRRTLLHFGAVDYECAIWINGGLAGGHRGGFDSFTLDVSEYLQPGANEILVGVTDPGSSGSQPRGKQHLKPQGIWYTPVSGIWQTVWLEQVPLEAHVEELVITPTADCAGIELTGFLHRPSRDPELALRVRIALNDRLLSEQTIRPDTLATLPIAEPALWSPDSPTLYDVEVTLLRIRNPLPASDPDAAAQLERPVPLRGATEAELYAQADLTGAREIDRVHGYFGLRHIGVGAHPEDGRPTMLLNGEPVFHLGPLDQGWWPDGLHTPPADAAIIYEIEYLKAAGFNTLRKHIKVEPARYYYHCDRLGMLVWQDMPSGFLPAQFVAPNDEGEARRNSAATETFELELQRMIHRLRGHPSIVIWVLHNEGWGQFDSARLVDRIRGLDPTRLINATSGWRDQGVGDLIDRHDYDSQPSPPEGDGRRALVIGEYGGIGWPIDAHLWNPDMRNWGYQTFHDEDAVRSAYENVTEAIVRMQRSHGVCAAIYTQTTDVEGEVNGLLTYDRQVEKLPATWLAEQHRLLTRP